MTSHTALLVSLPDLSAFMQVLIDVAIKGTIILVVARMLLPALRHASAAIRHLIWSGTVCGLLALPILAVTLPEWRVPILPSLMSTTSASSAIRGDEVEDTDAYVTQDMPGHVIEKPSSAVSPYYYSPKEFYKQNWNSASPLQKSDVPTAAISSGMSSHSTMEFPKFIRLESILMVIWLLGVLIVLTRMATGIARVWWLARSAERITDISWEMMSHNMASKLGLRKEVALLKSENVTLPMTCGAWRSVVLLPIESEQWSLRCRRIVLLHELAHVKRRDCLTQLFAQLACAFYWFNPLAWMAARQLRVEREFACDDQVLEVGTRPSDYASYLVEIASTFGAQAQNASVSAGMACSELESRVRAILNTGLPRKTLRFSQILLAFICAFSLLLPLAAMQPRVKAQGQTAANSSKTDFTDKSFSHQEEEGFTNSSPDQKQHTAADDQSKHKSPSTHSPEESELHELEVHTTQNTVTLTNEIMAEVKNQAEEQKTSQDSEPNGKRSANPTPDDLIKMKMYNITPEFIESVRKLGFDKLSLNRLVEMKIHNISESFIKEARSWGYDNLTLNQLLQLRIAGVTTDYIAAMQAIGMNNIPANKLSNLRMHNVTPEYIESMRRLGYDNLSAEQLLSLRIHGITEEYIRDSDTWGYGKLPFNDLLQVKMFNVTPAFAQEMKSIGFDNLPLKKLIQLKLHGVTVDYVQEMRGVGYQNLTVDQLLQMKIHGITAEYVNRLRAAGFKNVSVNQLLEMRISGVDEILLKKSQ